MTTMNVPTEDQIVASSKKRVRRNALKPNSVESDALREFSLVHTLDSKMALGGKGEEEQKGESSEESNNGDISPDTREKRQKIADSVQQIDRPQPETIETMSVGDHVMTAQPTNAEIANRSNEDGEADAPPIVGDDDSVSDEPKVEDADREK